MAPPIHYGSAREDAHEAAAFSETSQEATRPHHTPVLVEEVIEALRVSSTGRYLDATVGEGGHAEAILGAGKPGCRVLGLDLDPRAIVAAGKRPQHTDNRIVLVNASYAEAPAFAEEYGFLPLDGALFDCGLSSMQLDEAERGFSFREGPLDMRFSPSGEVTAEALVNRTPEGELARIIAEYGQEPRARRISRAIVRGRPLTSTRELAELIGRTVGRRGRIHPATRSFQALRIATNRELETLQAGINHVIPLLGPGARLCVITYHSLEARLVKESFRRAASDCICPPGSPVCRCEHEPSLRMVTKKSIAPSVAELRRNPRSRSARLRVAERLSGGTTAQ